MDERFSLKKGSCIKRGIAKFGFTVDKNTNIKYPFYLYVRTRGYGDKTVINNNIRKKVKFSKDCIKSRIVTNQKEKDEFYKEFPTYNRDAMLVVLEYDKTASEHLLIEEEEKILDYYINIVNHIDFEADLGGGENYWKHLGIPEGDYLAVALWLKDELQPQMDDLIEFNKEIERLISGIPTMAELELKLKKNEE